MSRFGYFIKVESNWPLIIISDEVSTAVPLLHYSRLYHLLLIKVHRLRVSHHLYIPRSVEKPVFSPRSKEY